MILTGTRWCVTSTRMRNARLPPGDDGHAVFPMDALDALSRKKTAKTPPPPESAARMSRADTRRVAMASLRAAFLLAAVFSLAIVGFVAFLLFIWK